MTTEAEIQEALDTVEAVILREQEAEQRGTTRFSRLPGLYAERDRLKYEIALENEPRDRAYALAAEISSLPNSDRLAVAARLRAAEPYLSVTAPGVQTFTRYDAEHHAPETRYVLAAEHEAAVSRLAGKRAALVQRFRELELNNALLRDELESQEQSVAAFRAEIKRLEARAVFTPCGRVIDVLRACRESLAGGLETVGSAEADWSTKDRALVARIDALLVGGES